MIDPVQTAVLHLQQARKKLANELAQVDSALASLSPVILRANDGVARARNGNIKGAATLEGILEKNSGRAMSAAEVVAEIPEEVRSLVATSAHFALSRLASSPSSRVTRARRGRYIWGDECASNPAASPAPSTPSSQNSAPAPALATPSGTTTAATFASHEVNS